MPQGPRGRPVQQALPVRRAQMVPMAQLARLEPPAPLDPLALLVLTVPLAQPVPRVQREPLALRVLMVQMAQRGLRVPMVPTVLTARMVHRSCLVLVRLDRVLVLTVTTMLTSPLGTCMSRRLVRGRRRVGTCKVLPVRLVPRDRRALRVRLVLTV